MASFSLAKEIKAPPELVFEVLTDHRGYPDLTPLRRVDLEREGEPAPNGVGAIRVLVTITHTARTAAACAVALSEISGAA